MTALLLMLLTLALLMGVACFAAVKTVKALQRGKIFYGPKKSPDWRDVYRDKEPCRFWEAIFMHALSGVPGFGGSGWMLLNLPEMIRKLV